MNTPKTKSSKIKIKRDQKYDKENETDEEIETLAHSTPDSTHPHSPIFFSCTQETENEVVWDWQSPQQKRVVSRYKPRVNLESPSLVVPFKRKLIVNKLNSLKEKLDALNEQIIKKKLNNVDQKKTDNFENLFEDDDSFTDCLVQCSQQIEKEYLSDKSDKTIYQTASEMSTEIVKNTRSTTVSSDSKLCDDSFDMLLGTINNEVLENLSQVPTSKHSDKNTVIQIDIPSKAENKYKIDVNNPRSINKSHSFESEYQTNCSPPLKCTPEEIEKKRREALAKLERKMLTRPKSSMDINVDESPSRKFQRRNHSFEISSPVTNKISPIQKSLEKLNEVGGQEIVPIKNWAKIQQDIEKKRLEAIARLQRKKNKGNKA